MQHPFRKLLASLAFAMPLLCAALITSCGGTEPINVSWEAVNIPAQPATCNFTLSQGGQQIDFENGLARDTVVLLAHGIPGNDYDVTITGCTKPGGGSFEIGNGSGCNPGGPATPANGAPPKTVTATPGPSLCHFRVKAI